MYPEQYKQKSVWDQIDMIQEVMPIDFDEGEVEKILSQSLPEKAEGLFVIPRQSESYINEIEKSLSVISESRKFYSHCQLRKKDIRRQEKTRGAISFIERSQKSMGDIIIIPTQFGLYYKGLSVKETERKMSPREFGLGAHEVSWMLFTHYGREYEKSVIHPLCPGDVAKVNKSFNFSPYFEHGGKILEFGVAKIDEQHPDFGAVTAFF